MYIVRRRSAGFEESEPSGDLPSRAIDLLINARSVLANTTNRGCQNQITQLIGLDFVGSLNRQGDQVGIGSRSHFEVIFKLSRFVAVVDQVNSGIKVFILDFRITRDISPPLSRIVADQVVRNAGKLIQPDNTCLRIGTDWAQSNRR